MFLKTPPQQKAMEKAYSETTNVARSKFLRVSDYVLLKLHSSSYYLKQFSYHMLTNSVKT